MAADFDAGSIEGTLDLNTKPFTAGLRRAREQARRFEKRDIVVDLDVRTGKLDAALARIQAEQVMLRRNAVAAPSIKMPEGAEGTSNVDVAAAAAKTAAATTFLQKAMAGAAKSATGFVKSMAGAAAGATALLGKVALLTTAVLTLSAALGPLSGAVLAFGGAALSAIGPLGIAFGMFGFAVAGAVKEMKKANSEGAKLSGWGGRAQTALKDLQKRWEGLSKSVRPQIFESMTWLLQGAEHALEKMAPVLKTVADGFIGLSREIHNILDSRRFKQFAGVLDDFMKGFMKGLTPVVRDLMYAFMTSFRELQPILSLFGEGIQKGAAALRKFTSEGQGLEKFVATITPWLPKIGTLIGHIFETLGKIGTGLAPLAGPALEFIDALVVGLGNVDWRGLANILVPVVQTLTRALPSVVDALNTVISLLETLSQGDWFGNIVLGAGAAYAAIKLLGGASGLGALASLLGLGGGKGGKHAARGGGGILGMLGGKGGLTSTLGRLAKNPLFKPLGWAAFLVGGAKAVQWSHKMASPLSSTERAARAAAREIRALKDATKAYQGTLDATTASATEDTRVKAYQRLQSQGLLSVAKELGMTERQMVQAVTGNVQARNLLARRLANNTTLTNAQKEALVRETRAVEQSKIGAAQKAVADAKMALATAGSNKEIAAARERLKEATARLHELKEKAKNGIKVNLETEQAKQRANALKNHFNQLFGRTINQQINVIRTGETKGGFTGIGNGLIAPSGPGKKPSSATGHMLYGAQWRYLGDNPSGVEAAVPLDQYDIPRKGEVARIAAAASSTNRQIVSTLEALVAALRDAADPEALADALDKVMGKHSDAQVRKMVQMQRSGAL